MLQKQHNYKPHRAGTGTGTRTGAAAQRQKEDKNIIKAYYALYRINVAFYIIFIIAIYRLDTKLAKKPCVKGFRPATKTTKQNNFIKIYLLDTRLLGTPNK